ncbi:MAG TPA: hypothetical protein VFY05_07130 [Candidatus Angelobacter sp.]|nr:hypothetical protein [Candidatus Angelobacter sp.]
MHISKTKLQKLFLLACAILSLAAFAVTQDQDQPSRGPSTPQERARFVAIAHKMEENPLDPSLRQDRDWATHWIIDIPDINVNPCANLLGNFMESPYRYKAEINGQVAFSMAAFKIEHPDKAGDVVATNTAALEGALKAYRSILRIEPTAQSPFLEGLAQEESEGKLTDYVRELVKKGCDNGDEQG